ncbi:hypothetical protein [Streptomyces sp. NPDC088910]|uniref:hypothetical protein n=1 Tax=Streptomyces sp. NPDC088910 TaxID=3365911 RepID=UPI0037FD4972
MRTENTVSIGRAKPSLATIGVLAVLAAVSSCGSNGTPRGDNATKGEETSSAAAPSGATRAPSSVLPPKAPGGVLDQHGLDTAALDPSDLIGYEILTIGGKGKPVGLLDTSQRIPIAPAACQPVWDVIRYRTAYPATGRVVQTAEDTSQDNGQQTSIILASYTPTTASLAISDLHQALRKCTAFKGIPGDTEYTYNNLKELPDPHLGDEAISYRMTRTLRGKAATMVPPTQHSYIVVRIGATLITFSSFGVSKENDKDTQIPLPVLAAQIKKLT